VSASSLLPKATGVAHAEELFAQLALARGAGVIQDLVVYLAYIGYALVVLLLFGTLLTWVERKQAAIMATASAPTAVTCASIHPVQDVWLGLFHGMATPEDDAEEDFRPSPTTASLRARAVVVFTPVMLVFGVVPFGGMLHPGELFSAAPRCRRGSRPLVPAADRHAGRRPAGGVRVQRPDGHRRDAGGCRRRTSSRCWRAARRLADDLLRAGDGPDRHRPDPDLRHRRPDGHRAPAVGRGAGLPAAWGIVFQPFAAILFITAAMAENRRIPFDLPRRSPSSSPATSPSTAR